MLRKRKRNAIIAVLAIGLLAFAGTAWADMFAPSHSCRKPSKPYQFTSEWEISSFKNDVDRFERCIEDFITEQQEAAQAHRDAAREAVEEWNRFVRYELR